MSEGGGHTCRASAMCWYVWLAWSHLETVLKIKSLVQTLRTHRCWKWGFKHKQVYFTPKLNIILFPPWLLHSQGKLLFFILHSGIWDFYFSPKLDLTNWLNSARCVFWHWQWKKPCWSLWHTTCMFMDDPPIVSAKSTKDLQSLWKKCKWHDIKYSYFFKC